MRRVGGVVFALVAAACMPPPREMPAVLPPGFAIEALAPVSGARRLLVVDDGRRILATTSDGRLVALEDRDRDGRVERVSGLLRGLDRPDGLAAGPAGEILIAERHRVIRLRGESTVDTLVPAGILPVVQAGSSRELHLGADGLLYIAVAAPAGRRAPRGFEGKIVRVRPDGQRLQTYARGVSTGAGLASEPESGDLLFVDGATRGLSLAELNRASRPGMVFSPEIPGPVVPPDLLFEPGIEPTALHVYDGPMFPEAYRGDAFVAATDGEGRALILRIRFESGIAVGTGPFLESGDAGGVRTPVDLATLPDGSLLLSDETGGVVWRITYRASPPAS